MTKKIRVKRVLTAEQDVSLDSYPNMTPEQAVMFEKGLDKDDQINAVIDASTYAEVEVTTEATIVDV